MQQHWVECHFFLWRVWWISEGSRSFGWSDGGWMSSVHMTHWCMYSFFFFFLPVQYLRSANSTFIKRSHHLDLISSKVKEEGFDYLRKPSSTFWYSRRPKGYIWLDFVNEKKLLDSINEVVTTWVLLEKFLDFTYRFVVEWNQIGVEWAFLQVWKSSQPRGGHG